MTREQLLDLICPTDVPKECEDGKSNCDICFGAMNRWLDKYDKLIVAKAIDKLVKKVAETDMSDRDYRFIEEQAKIIKEHTNG